MKPSPSQGTMKHEVSRRENASKYRHSDLNGSTNYQDTRSKTDEKDWMQFKTCIKNGNN